ncbi:hypothetical protein D3C73_743730 [compost metagenome]
MTASSAADCRLWRKELLLSSSERLRAVSTPSSEPVIVFSLFVSPSVISRVRAIRVSFSWRVRSASAALSFSVLASRLDARVSKLERIASPLSDKVELSISRRISNSVDSAMPEVVSVSIRFSVLVASNEASASPAASDFSIRAAARVSIIEAKASPDVARRIEISSVASASSSLSWSCAPTIEERMRSA